MKRKFYITTSIAYVNAAPHIGFALESIEADVLARYYRNQGDEVLFLTGTDEHGEKISRSAKTENITPKEYADRISLKFKELKQKLNLSNSFFIRTSDKEIHYPGALKLWKAIDKAGDLYKKQYQGLYCVGCEKFLTQKDLVDGNCPLHHKPPEVVEEENYFFRLSKYAKELKEVIESGKYLILPESRRKEILSFIDSGLEDISFSRPKANIPWGIPIPDSDQTMYVWCDALSNYISAIGYGRDENNFNKWWPADVHLVGKDILRFHAVIWPAMLMSAKIPLPKRLFVHGFITVRGEKMSKSIGNVIAPNELVSKYGVEPVRFYLIREIPSNEDGDFSYEKFEDRYEGELAKGLGNFASRVLTLSSGIRFSRSAKPEEKIQIKVEEIKESIRERIENFRLHEAITILWELVKFGDIYINQEKPWETKDKQVIFNLVYLLENIAIELEPFMPETAQKIKNSIKRNIFGIKTNKIQALFPRLLK